MSPFYRIMIQVPLVLLLRYGKLYSDRSGTHTIPKERSPFILLDLLPHRCRNRIRNRLILSCLQSCQLFLNFLTNNIAIL